MNISSAIASRDSSSGAVLFTGDEHYKTTQLCLRTVKRMEKQVDQVSRLVDELVVKVDDIIKRLDQESNG